MRSLELAAASGAIAAVVATEARNRRSLAADEQYRTVLKTPLRGTPVRASSADGTELYAEAFGPEEATTFVLFPGWTEELHYFDLLTRGLLDRGYRVVSCDLRGQGSSGQPADGDQRIERYGEDVAALLNASCDARPDVIIAGHSMGGMSIVAWAGLEGTEVEARVRGVALMNTGMSDLVMTSTILPQSVPAPLRRAFGNRVVLGGTQRYLPVSTVLGRAVLRHFAFGPSATAGHLAFYEPMLWSCPPPVRAGAGVTLSGLDLLASLERLTVPTLVIAGDVDRMTPLAHSETMAARLPNLTELLVLHETGHMSPLERPDQVVDALVGLAEKVAV